MFIVQKNEFLAVGTVYNLKQTKNPNFSSFGIRNGDSFVNFLMPRQIGVDKQLRDYDVVIITGNRSDKGNGNVTNFVETITVAGHREKKSKSKTANYNEGYIEV